MEELKLFPLARRRRLLGIRAEKKHEKHNSHFFEGREKRSLDVFPPCAKKLPFFREKGKPENGHTPLLSVALSLLLLAHTPLACKGKRRKKNTPRILFLRKGLHFSRKAEAKGREPQTRLRASSISHERKFTNFFLLLLFLLLALTSSSKLLDSYSIFLSLSLTLDSISTFYRESSKRAAAQGWSSS